MELHEVLFSVGGQGVAEIVRRRRQRRHANRARERSVFLFQVLTRPARGFVYYIKDRGYRVSQRPPSPELVRSPEPRDRCVVRVPDVRVGRLRSWARSRRRSGRLGSCGARVPEKCEWELRVWSPVCRYPHRVTRIRTQPDKSIEVESKFKPARIASPPHVRQIKRAPYKAWPMHAPRSLLQHSGAVGALTVLRRTDEYTLASTALSARKGSGAHAALTRGHRAPSSRHRFKCAAARLHTTTDRPC